MCALCAAASCSHRRDIKWASLGRGFYAKHCAGTPPGWGATQPACSGLLLGPREAWAGVREAAALGGRLAWPVLEGGAHVDA